LIHNYFGELLARDPVCGMMVDEGKAKFKLDYNGKTYYFCSAMCMEKFKSNPKKYVK
jgi:YHS domain-containing protein